MSLPTRPGTTFVELMLFLAIFSMVAVVALPLLFASTENRELQESISLVEQNGAQILQTLSDNVRHGERILAPAAQTKGKIILLQTSSGSTNPTVFGIGSGSFVMIQHSTRQIISSPDVAVLNFQVQNTSASATRQSVLVSFTVQRVLRLEAPHIYSQRFEALYTLYPADVPVGGLCAGVACPGPTCVGGTTYDWQVCDFNTCNTATSDITCQ